MNTNLQRQRPHTNTRHTRQRSIRQSVGPVFLQGFTSEQKEAIRALFTEAAQDASNPSAVITTARAAAQSILKEEPNTVRAAIAYSVIARLDRMPAFALSFAGSVLEGGIA